jgi:pimeloyl-ACP methyl ester carboxylesterase
MPSPQIKLIKIELRNKTYQLEYFRRPGNKGTILFVHGLGGAKENFWEATKTNSLYGYELIGFDNPGTGNSSYYANDPLNVDDLSFFLGAFLKQLGLKNIILAGASMGGLITLLHFQLTGTSNVKAYINIEGNLMPEDCMFSAKVVQHSYDHFATTVFPETIKSMKQHGNVGYFIIANNLELNTNVQSYYHYSFQTVAYSATRELLQQFLELDIPRLFIFGEKNQHLSYLPQLEADKLQCHMVSGSDHFVFYDNPREMYLAIADFLNTVQCAAKL